MSIVVPAFREAANIPELVERIERGVLPRVSGLELIIVDDHSRDGTAECVASLARAWVRLIVRTDERGLSSAVLRGCAEAVNETIVVMDADLSHPPEAIPKMLEELARGAEFVVGSRYIKGGSTDADWGVFRALNSRVATLLARPFTSINDPMSGFFALRRERFLSAKHVNPIGYKIGLELLVKCGCSRVAEVPIHFANRTRGESKLSMSEQVRYLRHLGRLMVFKVTRGG